MNYFSTIYSSILYSRLNILIRHGLNKVFVLYSRSLIIRRLINSFSKKNNIDFKSVKYFNSHFLELI